MGRPDADALWPRELLLTPAGHLWPMVLRSPGVGERKHDFSMIKRFPVMLQNVIRSGYSMRSFDTPGVAYPEPVRCLRRHYPLVLCVLWVLIDSLVDLWPVDNVS